MKKFYKSLLLLSVLVFVINCQAQTTNSDFQTVDDVLEQAGISKPPTEDDSTDELQPLSKSEFDIADKNDFNLKINSSYSKVQSIGIRFNITGSAANKIKESEIWDNNLTEKGATLTLVKYKNANHEELKTAIQLKEQQYQGDANFSATTYHIHYNKNLLNALPNSGSEAVYRVDFALKDRRNPKNYSLTKRSFEFTITRE